MNENQQSVTDQKTSWSPSTQIWHHQKSDSFKQIYNYLMNFHQVGYQGPNSCIQ